MEYVAFGGWEKNVRLVSGDTEIYVTTEVGPRILRYGFVGGPNELKVYEKDAGKKGGDEYRSYGGHRLWIAPEEDPKTLHPDNGPVEVSEEDGWTVFRAEPETWHIRKEIRIRPIEEGFQIEHRVYNEGVYDVYLAPWAITVVEPGGQCLFPQPVFQAHSERVLPVRPLVLWGYTNMADSRFTWGERVVRLRHDADGGNQKVGAQVEQGYAGYANHGNLFLKRFDYDAEAEYPDFGCNFETFTRADMLEIESVGAMQVVSPGDYAQHDEAWYLVPDVLIPEDDSECGDLLASLAAERPL